MKWFGSSLLTIEYCPDEGAAMAGGLQALASKGADVIVAAGAASLDPLDAIFEGLRMAGGGKGRPGTPPPPRRPFLLPRGEGRPPPRPPPPRPCFPPAPLCPGPPPAPRPAEGRR